MKRTPNRRIGLVDDHVNRKVTLGSCLELVLSQMGGLMDNVLDGLQLSAGLHPYKKPMGGQLRLELVPVVERLLENRDPLRNAFAGQMRVLSYGGISDSSDKPLVRFEDIQLLDMNQLDESIELARVQHELVFVVEAVLPRIHGLMSTLMGWITVQPGINPLRPELFAKALRDTLSAYVPVPEYRSELLAAAAGRMGVGLRQIYRELSEWLLSSGVEPAGTLASAAPAEAVRNPDKASEAARTLLTLDRLRRLFSAEMGADALQGGAGVDFLHTVPASVQTLQDMKQVEAMIQRLELRKKQRSSQAGNAATSSVDMMQRGPLDGRRLGEQIGEEVTRMMLENLSLDDRLLPKVRALLEALGPTLLALSKSDARFFSDAKHPARQFLDRVTDRSLAFSTEMEDGYARFIHGVEKSVELIAASRADKTLLFTQELERLRNLWANEDKAQIKLREETARALLHIEQRNLLAERLVQEWQLKVADPEVPQAVRDLMLGPWAQAVAESQLSFKLSAGESPNYLGLVDDLVWSVQPAKTRRNPQRLVQMIPGLLATLRAGLQLISYPPDLITRFFDQLISLHEAALQDARPLRERAEAFAPPPVEAPRQAPASLDSDDMPHPPSEHPDEAEEEGHFSQAPWLADQETENAGYLEADSVLPVDVTASEQDAATQAEVQSASAGLSEGAWVELMLEGRWTRLQLTWSSPHRTLFMFTSTRGRAHSMSRRTMHRLLAKGMIRIVSRGQILDQALDSVAQQALLNSIGNLPEPT
jgi:hypothetical protein